jgi:pimeloyl-ACP methyl ester carboxylesterase
MIALLGWLLLAPASHDPRPVGRLIDLGGHRLHMNCTGRGRPTVVIETGLGDFSFDWILVQRRLESTLRVCTCDRAGYAWSDPGPQPRTFDQLNLELHDALARAGERGPFVLVGHSFGGGPVRSFALRYPTEVAGLVLVEIVSEQQYIPMGRHAGRIGDDAKGRAIPPPHEDMPASRAPAGGKANMSGSSTAPAAPAIEPPYDRLPAPEQRLHVWASAQPSLEAAEDSQREWSAEYFARWAASSQKGVLGALPLIVLTREHGGDGDDLDMPAATLERHRLDAQRALAELSSAGSQRLVPSGHNMHLEVPDAVAHAIRDVAAARSKP